MLISLPGRLLSVVVSHLLIFGDWWLQGHLLGVLQGASRQGFPNFFFLVLPQALVFQGRTSEADSACPSRGAAVSRPLLCTSAFVPVFAE